MAKMTEETRIKDEIKSFLDATGWFHFHILQRRYAYKGISDIIAIRDGQVAFIEVKSKKGKLSPEQIKFQADVTASGGLYIVARSYVDVESAV